MSEYLRSKIKVLSFFLVILVVLVHSINVDFSLGAGQNHKVLGFVPFLQEFLCNGMFRIASPLFFIISGYLFFVNITGKTNEFVRKLKKRFRSLIIPYLFWSVLGLVVYFVLQSIPQAQTFFTKMPIRDYSTQKLLHTIFLDPIPYQLWYVRDLAVFAVLSPAIFLIIKYIRFWILPLCLFAWLVDFNFVIFRNQSLLFFILGALLSQMNKKLLNPQPSRLGLIFPILWVICYYIKTKLVFLDFQNELLIGVIHKIGILLGILAVNNLYDVLFKNFDVAKTRTFKVITYTFFIFASHEPLLTIIKKAMFYVSGFGEIWSLIIFILAPVITILLCILAGYILKRHTPKFYGTITGWR
jgi:surface polysaccharide O-acyltransferase-like enzyme